MKKDLAPVIKAMLKDSEFLFGGIFSKEDYYMKRYGLTFEEMSKVETYVYWALHPDR